MVYLQLASINSNLVNYCFHTFKLNMNYPCVLQGSSSLHLATQSGHVHVVSLLLSKSTILLHMKDKRGRTGIMLAAANGHLDMVTLLVGQGADINAADKVGVSNILKGFHHFKYVRKFPDVENYQNKSFLFIIIQY